MNHKSLTRLGLFMAVLVLIADQATKAWVLYGLQLPRLEQVVLLPVLNLTFVENRGVTFGMLNGLGAWSSLALAGVALAVVVALGYWLRRAESRITAIAIGAVAGGALGNVIDRLRLGWVVDFIDFHIGAWHWYVFNVADAAIVCGVAALVLESQFGRKNSVQQRQAPDNGA